jgi:hypothetical protein
LTQQKESTDAFRDYFERHRIFLPESLVGAIQRSYAQTSATSIGMLLTGISRAEALQDESQQQEYRRLLEDISEEVKEKIPSLRQDIEKEFRKLLGS